MGVFKLALCTIRIFQKKNVCGVDQLITLSVNPRDLIYSIHW